MVKYDEGLQVKYVYDKNHKVVKRIGGGDEPDYQKILSELGFDDTNQDSFQTLGESGYIVYYGETLSSDGKKKFYIINCATKKIETVL